MKVKANKVSSIKNTGIRINKIDFFIDPKIINDEYIQDKINRYYSSLKWENTANKLYRLYKNETSSYLEHFKDSAGIEPAHLNKFDTDFNNKNLFKYILVKPYLKQQTRKSKQENGEDVYEYLNNLLLTFDLEKCRELEDSSEIDYEYINSSLKIFLFIQLCQCLKDEINKYNFDEKRILNYEFLAASISILFTSPKITGIELSDTLISQKYLYEDYFYELSQLNLKNKDSLRTSSLKKQNLMYVFLDTKTYPTKYTPVEKEIKKRKKAEKRAYKLNKYLEQEYLDEKENANPFGDSLQEDYYYQTLGTMDYKFTPNPEKYRSMFIKFKKDANCPENNGIKVILNLYGLETVKTLLSMELSPGIYSDIAIINLNKHAVRTKIQKNFNTCILDKIFKDSKEHEKGFKEINKSVFSTTVNFIRDFVFKDNDSAKKQYYVIHKAIIITVLSKLNGDSLDSFLKKLGKKEKEIKELVETLQKKCQGVKGKAIDDLYKYFNTTEKMIC